MVYGARSTQSGLKFAKERTNSVQVQWSTLSVDRFALFLILRKKGSVEFGRELKILNSIVQKIGKLYPTKINE